MFAYADRFIQFFERDFSFLFHLPFALSTVFCNSDLCVLILVSKALDLLSRLGYVVKRRFHCFSANSAFAVIRVTECGGRLILASERGIYRGATNQIVTLQHTDFCQYSKSVSDNKPHIYSPWRKQPQLCLSIWLCKVDLCTVYSQLRWVLRRSESFALTVGYARNLHGMSESARGWKKCWLAYLVSPLPQL
jgi:hypothetical protein